MFWRKKFLNFFPSLPNCGVVLLCMNFTKLTRIPVDGRISMTPHHVNFSLRYSFCLHLGVVFFCFFDFRVYSICSHLYGPWSKPGRSSPRWACSAHRVHGQRQWCWAYKQDKSKQGLLELKLMWSYSKCTYFHQTLVLGNHSEVILTSESRDCVSHSNQQMLSSRILPKGKNPVPDGPVCLHVLDCIWTFVSDFPHQSHSPSSSYSSQPRRIYI